MALLNSDYNSTALARALAFVSGLVSIPSQTKRIYLNSSSSVAAPVAVPLLDCTRGDPATPKSPIPKVLKPREVRTYSDSLVETILLRLSKVSMFRDD